MKFYLIGIAVGFMLGCLPEEIEVTGEVCTVIDTTQQENMFCILGNEKLCLCPSGDINVQEQCDLKNLPDRSHQPSVICEEKP